MLSPVQPPDGLCPHTLMVSIGEAQKPPGGCGTCKFYRNGDYAASMGGGQRAIEL